MLSIFNFSSISLQIKSDWSKLYFLEDGNVACYTGRKVVKYMAPLQRSNSTPK